MSKVKLSDFTLALLRVHDHLVHVELEAIPFEMISPYVRELMFLEQCLESIVPTDKIASFHGISPERSHQLLEFDLSVSDFFSHDKDLRICIYKTLRVLYQLTYGIKSLSTNCCKEA